MILSHSRSTALTLSLVLFLPLASVQAATVLERVAAGGSFVIAHRESSIPFSYLDKDKKPVGYAMDICLKIADALRRKAKVNNMSIEYKMVTPSNRIATIAEGKADLECGSTTNNAERRQKVAFTIPHFITGARLLVRANSSAVRIEDFGGKTMVSTKGTTPLKAVEQANRDRLMGIKILEAPDHEKAVEMVEKGEAQAFVMDDVLLYGLISTRADQNALKVVGKLLTIEPLAIMLPKNDPEFKKIVDDEMRNLIQSRQIYAIYDKWFLQAIPPKNKSLNMPTSYFLKDFWKYPTDQVPF